MKLPLLVLVLAVCQATGQQTEIVNSSKNYSFSKIRAIQNVTTGSSFPSSIIKEEFFSLALGLSYVISIPEDELHGSWASIVDSSSGHSYYIRDAYENDESRIYCELDHSHNNRLVYPWRYRYSSSDSTLEAAKGEDERSIYGIGAIWLNLIRSRLELECNSSSELSTCRMERDNLEIELAIRSPLRTDTLSIELRPETIQLKAFSHVSRGEQDESFATIAKVHTHIKIETFEHETSPNSETLERFFRQLSYCREFAKDRRLFPSLLQTIMRSPQRMYALDYLTTSFVSSTEVQKERSTLRPVYARELTSEWFSLKREAISTSYSDANEGLSPRRTDIFIRLFTELEFSRPDSLFKTGHYHVTHVEGAKPSCTHEDVLAKLDPTMHYSIELHRQNKSEIRCIVTGLGAVLLNAAESSHKEFSMSKKRITLKPDPLNRNSKTVSMKVDEWRLLFRGRIGYFYFRDVGRRSYEINDLLRVELKQATKRRQLGGSTGSEELLFRFDIIEFRLEANQKELDQRLKPHDICFKLPFETTILEDLVDSEEEVDVDDDFLGLFDVIGEIFGLEDPLSNQAEDVEFSRLNEDSELPNFFQFMKLNIAYSIESLISFGTTKVYLKEYFDTERELALYNIYHGEVAPGPSRKADVTFFVNFNYELIFKCPNDQRNCSIVEDYDDWMLPFTCKLDYYRTSDDSSSRSTSYTDGFKLHQFGVGALWRAASESEFTGLRQVLDSKDNKNLSVASWYFHKQGDLKDRIYFNFSFKKFEYERAKKSKSRVPDVDELFSLTDLIVTNAKGIVSYPAEQISARILKVNFEVDPSVIVLPEECQSQSVAEAMKAHAPIKPSVPKLEDFLDGNRAYSAVYSVMSMKHNLAKSQQVEEWYDVAEERGVIKVFGLIKREIYISIRDKVMLLYIEQTKQCKKVNAISSLIDLDGEGAFEVISNGSSTRQVSFFGLASLWNRLQEVEEPLIHVSYSYDEAGQRREIRKVEATSQNGYLIEAEFVAVENDPTAGKFELRYVRLNERPAMDAEQASDLQLSTVVQVKSVKILHSRTEDDIWSPPEACTDLLGTGSVQTESQLPSVKPLLRTEYFYMRSFVTNKSSILSQSRTNYLFEEWYHQGDLRLKTQGLERNLDLLIFPSRDELFDISRPYSCSSRLPSQFQPTGVSSSAELLHFWTSDSTVVDSPAQLYYSPLGLWLLAEKSSGKVRLINRVELGPHEDPNGLSDDFLQRVERDMRTEVWQVDCSTGSWSYRLYFQVHFENTRNRYTLERIELTLNQGSKMPLEINIDVINYRSVHRSSEIEGMFLIPEGFGCKRKNKPTSESYDILDLDLSLEHKIWYEASMQFMSVVDDAQVPKIVSGQHQIGLFARTGSKLRKDSGIDFFAHYNKKISGQYISSLEVMDKSSAMTHWVDRSTGKCTNNYKSLTNVWTLNFKKPSPGNDSRSDITRVHMTDRFISFLLLNTSVSQFELINSYAKDGLETRVYELYTDALAIESGLLGSMAIIRTFTFRSELNDKVQATRVHRKLSVKVLVKAGQGRRPESVLNLKIGVEPKASFTDLLRLADVSQCFRQSSGGNRKSKKFALEYQLDTFRLAMVDIEQLEQDFSRTFMKAGNISVSQFVDPPRIETSPSLESLTVYFNLFEAPTAIEYFLSHYYSRMNYELELEAEIKLAESLNECSRWCDESNCIALSYCEDRSCRILTSDIFDSLAAKTSFNNTYTKLFQFQMSGQCTYYHSLGRKSKKRLSDLARWLDQLANKSNGLTKTAVMALDIGGSISPPTRFYELDSEFEDLLGEKNFTKSWLTNSYITYRRDLTFQSDQLSRAKEELDLHIETFQSKTEAECLEACQSINCRVVSYCKLKDDTCITIQNEFDLKSIDRFSKPTSGLGCTILVRDPLLDYTLFRDTSEPKHSEISLDNYSPLECAALCQVRTPEREDGSSFRCESFDSCTTQFHNPDEPERRVCHLQSLHILDDNFDRSILSTLAKENRSDSGLGAETNCDHYSKSALADYEKLSYRKLKTKRLVEIRGQSEDKCAIDCLRDTTCIAFEYCFNDAQLPAQSCYYITSEDIREINELKPELLQDSKECYIYILIHQQEIRSIKDVSGSIASTRPNNTELIHWRFTWRVSGLMFIIFGSIALASVIQFTYIRLCGKPLPFRI